MDLIGKMIVFTAPGPPKHLAVSGTSTNEVTLSWNITDKPNGAITGYIICYQGKVYDDLDWSSDTCESKVDIGSTVTHTVYQLISGNVGISVSCLERRQT